MLYRFSLGLLKMNEGGICNKADMLALMKYLKKIGRQVHDIDDLFKVSIVAIPFLISFLDICPHNFSELSML